MAMDENSKINAISDTNNSNNINQESFLVDKEVLEAFADQLIELEFPGKSQSPDFKELRDLTIKKTDDTITNDIVNSLNDEQREELSKLIDNGMTEEIFEAFWKRIGVDLNELVQSSIKKIIDVYKNK